MGRDPAPARSTRVSLPCVTDPPGRCLCTVRVMRQWERLLAAFMLVGATVRLASPCCISSTSSLSLVTATCAPARASSHSLRRGIQYIAKSDTCNLQCLYGGFVDMLLSGKNFTDRRN